VKTLNSQSFTVHKIIKRFRETGNISACRGHGWVHWCLWNSYKGAPVISNSFFWESLANFSRTKINTSIAASIKEYGFIVGEPRCWDGIVAFTAFELTA